MSETRQRPNLFKLLWCLTFHRRYQRRTTEWPEARNIRGRSGREYLEFSFKTKCDRCGIESVDVEFI